ncbi:MAG: cation diffusion facilitator family transporter [Cyanothece sp. SIO1E1]|nr:cation diffusion facilitator family transporter [Cyanothece sp. SIO1E1]
MREVYDRKRTSYLILFTALWLTLLVLAVKVWAGWATKSLSLMAESLHTLIVGFSTLLSLALVASPFRLSNRGVWGYGKREVAGILLLTSFLGFSGFSLLMMSVQQLEAATRGSTVPFPVHISLPLIQLVGVVIAISLILACFESYEAKALESPALRLNSRCVFQDVWLTMLLIAGLLAIWQGYVWLDPLLAIFLVLMTIRSLWQMLSRQLPLLVRQTAIAPETLSQIAHQVEGVIQCHCRRCQGIVGRQVLIELRLVLHPEFMGVAHIIAERVEGAIRERYGPIQARIRIDGDRPLSPKLWHATQKDSLSQRRRELD